MLLSSRHNTNYATQLLPQYLLQTMLNNSRHNTDNVAQLYAQHWLCYSALGIKLTSYWREFFNKMMRRRNNLKRREFFTQKVACWCGGANAVAKNFSCKSGAVAQSF